MDDCLGGLISAYETSDILVQVFRINFKKYFIC